MKRKSASQGNLFSLEGLPKVAPGYVNIAPEKYQGAMLFSAVGDALGWPIEFENTRRYLNAELPLKNFIAWNKKIGGRFWGYLDNIEAGSYSDDTQLTLAIARSINETGDFEPERFAYEELPLWLHYERGGGRATKTAARMLVRRKTGTWLNNYYNLSNNSSKSTYFDAGANGAAMRNLPIALVKAANEKELITDSFLNSIITHGHSRAILASILFGLAVRHVLLNDKDAQLSLVSYLLDSLDGLYEKVCDESRVNTWIHWRNNFSKNGRQVFENEFRTTVEESLVFLKDIPKYLKRPSRQFFSSVGALFPETKGSGISTVIAALFLFAQKALEPENAIYEAANMIDSDTDTIAGFLGALLGAHHGIQAIPKHLRNAVQDKDYILKMAVRLHEITNQKTTSRSLSSLRKGNTRLESYLQILAWEIGLHEMFWDALDKDDVVYHPTLGRGIIQNKTQYPIKKEGYVAKVIGVSFDCGQTCSFRSLVRDDLRVTESLFTDVEKDLDKIFA
jgi:ADP-ribosylglycohydrolase